MERILADDWWKDIPKSESFVTCTRNDGAAVWTHGQVEDSEAMACQGDKFLHRWIFPQMDLIFRKAMCTGNFVHGS